MEKLTPAESLAIMESQRAAFFELYSARHDPAAVSHALPVVIISRGLDTTPEIRAMQAQQVHISSKARHIVAEKSGTQIHMEDPSLVADAIRGLMK